MLNEINDDNYLASEKILHIILNRFFFFKPSSYFVLDALSVDYTKRETSKRRGWTIVGTLSCTNVGAAALYLMVGFGLNSPAYRGSFCDLPLTYQHVLMVYLATCVLGLLNSLLLTYDIPLSRDMTQVSIKSKVVALVFFS